MLGLPRNSQAPRTPRSALKLCVHAHGASGGSSSSTLLSSTPRLTAPIENHVLDWLISRYRFKLDSQSRGPAATFICFAARCAIQFSSPYDRFSRPRQGACRCVPPRLSGVLSSGRAPASGLAGGRCSILSAPFWSFTRSAVQASELPFSGVCTVRTVTHFVPKATIVGVR